MESIRNLTTNKTRNECETNMQIDPHACISVDLEEKIIIKFQINFHISIDFKYYKEKKQITICKEC